MNNLDWEPEASASNNGDFMSIESYCGYTNPTTADPAAPEFLLNIDSSDEEVGKTILEALKNSKPVTYEEMQKLRINLSENYKAWIQRTMEKYGYKTKRALFKNMKSCSILRQDNLIIIKPSYHEKLEGWSGDGIKEEDYVKLPAASSFSEIGAGLRLAFERCI
ncbi:MAG: CdiI family contact-dependent growth inhibition immunity protein [Verrucomicrobia bacterium]|nr:CdiI family contact-dependent growth inhibition immunity protein [Verrucomicrobiota bacterium]